MGKIRKIREVLCCRYNCFLCDFDLCVECANQEEGILKRRASSADSLSVVHSRRTSTDPQLQSSTRRSSQIIHPSNLPNLRRLSSISQTDPPPIPVPSSRKSSKSDEKFLLRSSSNIQQKFTDKKTNSSLTNGPHSRRSSNQLSEKQKPGMIIHHEYKEGKSSLEKKVETKSEEVKKSNPSLIVVNVFVNEDKSNSVLPITDNNKDDKNKILPTPAKSVRRHSDAAIINKTPIYSGSRRLSCFPTNHVDHHLLENIAHSVEQVIAGKSGEDNGSP